jgi:malate/lactate dehydrogenase
LPKKQVFGFGGDLDTNRLRYILKSRDIYYDDAHAVGEHGPNAIPLYPSEQDYEEVTKELRAFWGKIATNVDIVRNIATADLLGKLVHSVVHDTLNVHNVCAYHPEHGMYITWPFAIGKYGVEEPLEITLTPKMAPAFMELLQKRKAKDPA